MSDLRLFNQKLFAVALGDGDLKAAFLITS
jgi:hypothetical protein